MQIKKPPGITPEGFSYNLNLNYDKQRQQR